MNKLLKWIALIPFSLLLITASNSQELARKGTFGIQMEGAPNGIRVVRVIENTTASGVGLQAEDILVEINGQYYTDVNPLVAAIGAWRVNDPIAMKVSRGEKLINLKGKVVGKPFETSENGSVIYGEVDYDGGKLRSILIMPHGVEQPETIMFLPGVGCGSLDYYYADKDPIKLLIEGLVQQGFAVYRVEKPGMGDSFGPVDCLEMDFDYEVAAMEAGLKELKNIATINSDKIFLYGHSLGSISAPLIAARNKVAGIIAWGGLSKSWYEYELRILRDQRLLMGADYLEVDQNFRTALPFYHDFYINKKSPKQLSAIPEYVDLSKQIFHKDLLHGMHHYKYFQNLSDIDVATAYKQANCPVLAIAGRMDLHAIDTQWAKDIAAVVNRYRPNDGTYVVVPKTTHHYFKVPSMAEYVKMRRDGQLNSQYIADHFNSEISVIVGQWVKRLSRDG